VSKTQLAANQLAIAVLHKYRDTYISLTPRTVLQFGNENFIAPKFQIATPDGIFYIEALRRNGHTEFLKKLERYDQYFKECPDKLGTVCITLENNAEVEILKNEIAPLKLSFKVGLTTDLECIPFEPEMIYPTQKQNFFTHLFKRA
jgi:hypothetical protein